MLRVLMFLLPLVLAVYALVDCIQTPDEKVRHIPKIAWIVLIVLIGVVGPIAWLITGRQRNVGLPGSRRAPEPLAPDDDPDFLRRLRDDEWRSPRSKRDDDPDDPPDGNFDGPR